MVQRVTNVMVNLETIGSLAYNLTVAQSATKDMNVVYPNKIEDKNVFLIIIVVTQA